MFRTAWVGILAFLADRISKQLVMDWLQDGVPVVIWEGVLNFTFVKNTGIAFSILADRTWLLIALSVAALALMVEALRRALQRTPMQHALLWLLLAGGLGNLIDRLLFQYVIDFIHIQFISFPVFNVADICLTAAAIFLIMALLRNPDEKKHVNEEPAA